MAGLEALHLVVSALLVVAGMAKLVGPEATTRALAEAGWRLRPVAVRGLGAVEVTVGTAALLVGGRITAALLAAAYLVVTAVAWRQRRAGADCGCFGASAAPVSGLHVAVNVGAVAVAATAVVVAPTGLPAALVAAPWGGMPTLGALAAAVAAVWALLTALPDLEGARALHAPEVDA